MNDKILDLKQQVIAAVEKLDIDSKRKELAKLNEQMLASDFWSDNLHAQKVSKQAANLGKQIELWTGLEKDVTELEELNSMGDESLAKELEEKLRKLEKQYAKSSIELYFSAKYDKYDAILSLQAGAGGTDAQDWAEMLLKMYTKWAESSDYKVELLDQSVADDAGIKNATIRISGNYIYGRLKHEHGVHRLVRLSPFNSANSRETSFAMVEVVPEIDEPDEFEVDEADIKVDVFRAGGRGGQSVNTTDSAVRLTHIPTGIVVSIQNERSQLQNKETAMKILRSKLAQLALEQHKEKVSELKGPNQEAAWGNQIRNYVLHPYTIVKDSRSGYETTDVDSVLNGNLDELINSLITKA